MSRLWSPVFEVCERGRRTGVRSPSTAVVERLVGGRGGLESKRDWGGEEGRSDWVRLVAFRHTRFKGRSKRLHLEASESAWPELPIYLSTSTACLISYDWRAKTFEDIFDRSANSAQSTVLYGLTVSAAVQNLQDHCLERRLCGSPVVIGVNLHVYILGREYCCAMLSRKNFKSKGYRDKLFPGRRNRKLEVRKI
jgi:hypothetical protein